MLEIEAIYRQIGIRQNVLAFGGQIEKELKERFEQINLINCSDILCRSEITPDR